MSDPRFDQAYDRLGNREFERLRAEQAGASGLWTAGFLLGLILLIGALFYFVPDEGTRVANNQPSATDTVGSAPPPPAPPAPQPQQ